MRRSLRPALALALALAAPSALAQTAPEPPSTQPAAQPANTLTEEQRAEARAALRRGNELFSRNNYEAALTEFLRVYDVAQSRPNAFIYLLNIARCYERMFRYDQSIQYYQRYLERAPADDPDRAAAQATMTALEGLLATLEIQSNVPDAQVWVDDRQVAERAGSVRIPGGVHVVELRARGYAPSRQQVQLPARTTQQISFRLERLNVRRGLHPAFFATVTGVGVVAGITTVVLGTQVLSARAEVDRLAMNPNTANQIGQDQKDRIRTLAVVTDVMLGVTIASAIGATLLGVATEWRRPPEADSSARGAPTATRVTIAPMASHNGAGLTVGGTL